MRSKSQFPRISRGYLCCFASFILLAGTVIYALWFVNHVASLNYEIAQYNHELIAQGLYVQIPQITIDMSIFNWVISAESVLMSAVTVAQLIKKRVCNVYQYAEEWLDKWFGDPEVRPYITQIVQSWMCSNTTSLNINK